MDWENWTEKKICRSSKGATELYKRYLVRSALILFCFISISLKGSILHTTLSSLPHDFENLCLILFSTLDFLNIFLLFCSNKKIYIIILAHNTLHDREVNCLKAFFCFSLFLLLLRLYKCVRFPWQLNNLNWTIYKYIFNMYACIEIRGKNEW